MVDVHSKEVRSFNMSRIRGKDSKPELLVRKFLFTSGFRYRLHVKALPGKPDIVLKKYNAIIFIHGCFWHKHENCRYFVIPKSRTEWWIEKLNQNVKRDILSKTALENDGWRLLIVWECQLRKEFFQKTFQDILSFLGNV